MVVNAPADIEDLCVSVRLDTAHYAEFPNLAYDTQSVVVEGPRLDVPPPSKSDPNAIKTGRKKYKTNGWPFQTGWAYYDVYERTETATMGSEGYRIDTDGGYRILDGQPNTLADGGRPAVEPWLPYQYRWGNVLMLGLVVGVLGAYIAYLTASPFLAFGISVVALVFLNADVAEIPVIHHMALPASTAVLALVDAPVGQLIPSLVTSTIPLWEGLLVGAGFGIVGAVFGEICQRVFYAHAETHLDPPAASIVGTSLAIGVLVIVGVLPSPVWIPIP